ncbi:unnamed protein product [Mesocestoides corti]|uniref:Uncharacterized protein n=1 Tax=Mesocestoides corti TaxID=53468 RepID=A0A0R3UCE5_MESCO|nr:unnamed protein product [Mesocestoides corti]
MLTVFKGGEEKLEPREHPGSILGGHPGERTTVESLQPPTSDHTESYWTELIGPDICSPDSVSLAVFRGSLMQSGEMVPVLGTSIKWVAF